MRPSLVLGLLLFAIPAWAATWTVAASGGDFTVVQAALDVAVAGDAIQVRAKATPYFEKLVFPRSGTAGAYITLLAYPGEHPILDGTGIPGRFSILLEDRSWVRVIGFEIRNNHDVDYGAGIWITGAGSHIEVRDNDIHDIRGRDAMGIAVFGTEATSISDLVVDGNVIHDCDPAHSEALVLNGNVERFEVTNNVVRDVDNIGIDFIGGESDVQPDPTKVARDGVCRGNRVERARSSYGGGFAAGIYVDGGRDIVIENNVVTESDLGIEIGAENAGLEARNVIVRSNVLYANDKAGLVFGGFAASAGRVRDSRFTNNTVVGNDTLGAGFGELWIQHAEDNVVRSNVFVSTAQRRLLTSDAGNVGNVLDYNVWHTPGGAAGTFLWNGTEHTGFAAYRTQTGQDAASQFVDPAFVDAPGAGFHVSPTSPAINAGDPAFVASPGEVDLDGAPRVSGPRVDAGADEITCGDGVPNPGEDCDDGNPVDGDGCDTNCTTTGCGNGIVTLGELCDDGNLAAGDCCGPACTFDAPATSCADGLVCTTGDECDGAGGCFGAPAPRTGCHAGGRTTVTITNLEPSTRNRLAWKWADGDSMLADLGDPVGGTTTYTLCAYDTITSVSSLLFVATAPAGGSCRGKPCWTAQAGVGFKYGDRDRTPDGITTLALRSGAAGRARITLKGKGDRLPAVTLPAAQDPRLTIQLVASTGVCWESVHTAPARRNDAERLRAVGD